MSADYAAILTTLHAAVADWAGSPVRVKDAYGREVEYRSLDELVRAIKTYTALAATASDGQGVRLTPLAAGGPTG